MKLSLLHPLFRDQSYSKASDIEKKEFIKTALKVGTAVLALLANVHVGFSLENCFLSVGALSLLSPDAANMLLSSFFFYKGGSIVYSAFAAKAITVKSALIALYAFHWNYQILNSPSRTEGVLDKYFFSLIANKLV